MRINNIIGPGQESDFSLIKSLGGKYIPLESTRRRLYGILLQEHPESTSLQVKELVMTGPGSLDSPRYVYPEYPPTHPGLLYLHSDRSTEAEVARYKLFAWAVSPHLAYQSLMELEPAEIAIVARLYIIQHHWVPKILQQWELNVFLVQFFVLKNLTAQDIREMPNVVPTARGAHLASLFARNSTLMMLNWGLGELVPTSTWMPINQFDGKLFQTIYAAGKNNCTVADLLKKVSRKTYDPSVEDRIRLMLNIINADEHEERDLNVYVD